MFRIRTILKAVQSWWRRRGGPRTSQRAGVALEQLDHRQLLAVNFTGNVFNDFPATTGPGVAFISSDSTASHPGRNLPPDVKPFIPFSGWDIDALRMKYTPEDDILSIGIQQPINPLTPPPGASSAIAGRPVIAGDVDDNGDDGTVNPNVLTLRPNLIDDPTFQGTETMGVFLDFNNDGIPDVVAGISNDVGQSKLYQVADAVPNPNPDLAKTTAPGFGTTLPSFTGLAYHVGTDPARGALE
ncbi:MAG: hypothetical protein IRY99_13940, partial [Isosphaeraceae bacterium]|nr:hypothetical protein [Isosphaeraceae bacterium]